MVRITKPGGRIIITTPTKRAKNILEFLSHNLHVLSRREIEEHKRYFDKSDLLSFLKDSRIKRWKHCTFECGMNNLLVVFV